MLVETLPAAPPVTPLVVHPCQPAELEEVRLSTCPYGCKVMRCAGCQGEHVVHMPAYGCPPWRPYAVAPRR
ncbi:hypothetical protein BDK92_7187 [Micromonospora pisi]|uniref:Uncharacterized protein n=1 Tax=Micromonospora pisi TaxID=589240 RepID=A0A495JX05_9ACTN|nr:hypothetical protein [Micromonospora pisi]RKR92709.1 hypothetical protein BDK92_7187 [Micromonospora pisi]